MFGDKTKKVNPMINPVIPICVESKIDLDNNKIDIIDEFLN